MNPQLDIYGNIGEIRDALDTLLKRGKPASVADLQALIATVEAKSRPTLTFPAAEAARLLAPQLLPLLPTPDNLAAAGKQAAAFIKAGIGAGTQQSIDQVAASVQESTRQITAATAALTKAAESVPRSVPVDFLQGWRWPVALAVTPLAVTILFLWIGGAFSGVSQAKYDSQRAVAQESADERDFYQLEIDAFKKDMQTNPETRKIVKTYFSKYVPRPAAEAK
jgi:hypothetical protein